MEGEVEDRDSHGAARSKQRRVMEATVDEKVGESGGGGGSCG